MPSCIRRITFLAALLALFAQGAATQAASDESRLFRGAYVSKSVTKDSVPRPLAEETVKAGRKRTETRLRVRFDHYGVGDVIRWRAGCNHFGAEVDFGHRSLVLSSGTNTDILCSKPLQRQDAWLVRFFYGEPTWALDGRKLKLKSNGTVIKLRRRVGAGS